MMMMMMKSRRSHSVTLISFCSVWRRRKSMVMSLQQTNLQLELKAADRGGGTTPPPPAPQRSLPTMHRAPPIHTNKKVVYHKHTPRPLPTMHCFPSSQLTNSWSVMSWGILRGGENVLKMKVYHLCCWCLFIFYYLIIFTRELMI